MYQLWLQLGRSSKTPYLSYNPNHLISGQLKECCGRNNTVQSIIHIQWKIQNLVYLWCACNSKIEALNGVISQIHLLHGTDQM